MHVEPPAALAEYQLKPNVSATLCNLLAQNEVSKAIIAAVMEAEGLSDGLQLVADFRLVQRQP